MNQNDINCLFTEKVTELLAQGFQINPGTMSGCQGEIAHVDLRKGDEILRVYMEHISDYGQCYNGYMLIRVGRNTDPIRNHWRDDTIWNSHLEILSEIKLAKITDNYFTTLEKGAAAAKKRLQHWKSHEYPSRRELTGDAFKSIALKYVRKQPRMKSCRLEDITKVVRVNETEWGKTLPSLDHYEITARGHIFRLNAPRRAQ